MGRSEVEWIRRAKVTKADWIPRIRRSVFLLLFFFKYILTYCRLKRSHLFTARDFQQRGPNIWVCNALPACRHLCMLYTACFRDDGLNTTSSAWHMLVIHGVFQIQWQWASHGQLYLTHTRYTRRVSTTVGWTQPALPDSHTLYTACFNDSGLNTTGPIRLARYTRRVSTTVGWTQPALIDSHVIHGVFRRQWAEHNRPY